MGYQPIARRAGVLNVLHSRARNEGFGQQTGCHAAAVKTQPLWYHETKCNGGKGGEGGVRLLLMIFWRVFSESPPLSICHGVEIVMPLGKYLIRLKRCENNLK